LHIGTVRQVYDDFEDYFPNHHEPFSDFLSESNRLPEVFFKKQITRARKQEIIKHINKQEFYKVREKILTNEVRRELYDFCEQEVKKCKRFSTKFDYSGLIENYEEILTKM
jgi:geranylgeranyl pyrophosphate synthase